MVEESLDVSGCVRQVRDGSQEAAERLLAHLYPQVLKIVRAHLPRGVAEEDLAQEVFVKVFTRIDQYRGTMPISHWASRIAVNTCRDQLRSCLRRPELRWADLSEGEAAVLEATLSDPSRLPANEYIDARELVHKLLERLKPEDRMVITLLDLEDKTVAEVKALTGWSTSAVKVRAFRARNKLKKELARLEKGRS